MSNNRSALDRWGGGDFHVFNSIISIQNLLESWKEFYHDKKQNKDVQEFSLKLMDRLMEIHEILKNETYNHGQYQSFKINDPKPRDIHKSSVKDRLVHHAMYRQLYWFFDKQFIYDSYSCRKNKGTHKALFQFKKYAEKVSSNYTKTCWVLKCDIKKFFASIDHEILKDILKQSIRDEKVLNLFENVIDSFYTKDNFGVGLPLGNLTSQLLVNIYMNQFDRFVKYDLKQECYIRYADDFVFFSQSKFELENSIPQIQTFLRDILKLQLHPQKVSIKTIASGVDFLGWIHFPNYKVIRHATKKRMLKKIYQTDNESVIISYLGLLSHGNEYYLKRILHKRLIEIQKNS